MLNSRASALNARDINGFLQNTTDSVKEFEKPIAEAALKVPIVVLSLKLANSARPDGNGNFSEAGVDLVYRWEGLPEDNLFRLQFSYNMEKVGSWTVMESKLRDSILPVWANGPILHSRFGMFLALYRPTISGVDRTLQLAQQARDALEQKVTHPLETGYLIVLAKDREEYVGISANSSPVSAIAQAETTYQISSSSIDAQARYIIVNLDALYSSGSAVETLQHELGHLALAVQTRPFTPSWVSESAAMYLANTRPSAAWRAGVRNRRFDSLSFGELTRSASIGQHAGTAESASLEYAYAAAAAYYLIETFGAERYWEFYSSYTDIAPGAVFERIPEAADSLQSRESLVGLGEEITASSIQNIYGLTLEQLDTNVREWIRKAAQTR